jgi:hypothetical protein
MDVDEAWSECKTIARHAFVGITIGEIADCDDSPVCDADVGGKWRTAVAVIDAGSLEDRPEQRLT